LNVAGLREGENIFRVNLARVHERLQDLPTVDELEVVRKLPGEIDIRIVERKPIGWITSEKQIADPFASDAAFSGRARRFDEEKKLFAGILGTAVILGCASESLEAGKIVESPGARACARVAAAEHAQLYADAVSDSRDRCFERLLPGGDRQKPQPRDVPFQ